MYIHAYIHIHIYTYIHIHIYDTILRMDSGVHERAYDRYIFLYRYKNSSKRNNADFHRYTVLYI